MTKVILSGCSGKMGHAIVKAIDERNDCEIACGVDAYDCGDYDFTVYKSFSEITEKYDAIIDFSNPAVLDTMLDYAVTNAVPAVICTTGFSEEQIAEIKNASEKTGIFYSGNMSLGINLMVELCKMATKVFANHGDNFDIEVKLCGVEKYERLDTTEEVSDEFIKDSLAIILDVLLIAVSVTSFVLLLVIILRHFNDMYAQRIIIITLTKSLKYIPDVFIFNDFLLLKYILLCTPTPHLCPLLYYMPALFSYAKTCLQY